MSVDPRELVTSSWNAFVKGDIKTLLNNMSDDVTWFIPGAVPTISGLRKGKGDVLNFARWAAKTFPSGLHCDLKHVHVSGNTVLMEMVNSGKMFNGKDYSNEYCFVFEVNGGKITAVREYVDTDKVRQLLGY